MRRRSLFKVRHGRAPDKDGRSGFDDLFASVARTCARYEGLVLEFQRRAPHHTDVLGQSLTIKTLFGPRDNGDDPSADFRMTVVGDAAVEAFEGVRWSHLIEAEVTRWYSQACARHAHFAQAAVEWVTQDRIRRRG